MLSLAVSPARVASAVMAFESGPRATLAWKLVPVTLAATPFTLTSAPLRVRLPETTTVLSVVVMPSAGDRIEMASGGGTKLTVMESDPVLPAASVAVATTAFAPGVSVTAALKEAPSSTAGRPFTVTLAIGLASLTLPAIATSGTLTTVPFAGASIDTLGGALSSTTVTAVVAAPKSLLAVTVMGFAPATSGTLAEKVVPLTLAEIPSTRTLTGAVPVKLPVTSSGEAATMAPSAGKPTTTVGSSPRSTVTLAETVLPKLSVAVAVRTFSPISRGTLAEKVLPVTSAATPFTTTPARPVASETVPSTRTLASVRRSPSAGLVMATAGGVSSTTVIVRVAAPNPLLAVALTLFAPSTSGMLAVKLPPERVAGTPLTVTASASVAPPLTSRGDWVTTAPSVGFAMAMVGVGPGGGPPPPISSAPASKAALPSSSPSRGRSADPEKSASKLVSNAAPRPSARGSRPTSTAGEPSASPKSIWALAGSPRLSKT